MSLRAYRQKRDFSATPEPAGDAPNARSKSNLGKSRPLRFVVQEHHATRLHYDFRLEHGGVLWSWAVPKEPSLDPKVRRLAIRTEDHPLAYASFEGVIPKDHYGGGRVIRWDAGNWIPESDPAVGIRSGKLTFRLEGERLRGHFHLTRLRGRDVDASKENWLLIGRGEKAKKSARSVRREQVREPVARASRPPQRGTRRANKPSKARKSTTRFIASDFQLATLVDTVPVGSDWLHETKYDGYRVALEISDGRCRVITRGGHDWTSRFKSIAVAAAKLETDRAILDGEIVALDSAGRSNFQLLQRVLKEGGGKFACYVFDLLEQDGEDLRPLPLIERKRALKKLLQRGSDSLRYADHVDGRGGELWKEACRLGLEGVISKRRSAPHRAGRGLDWRKSKCTQRQEFVIGGFTDPKGSRSGIGALLIGVYREGALRFAGKVGTGFDNQGLGALRRRLDKIEQVAPSFVDPPRERGVHWVRPRLVGEVSFTGWTDDGRLRHPSFQGFREDKNPRAVVREQARPQRRLAREPAAIASRTQPKRPTTRARGKRSAISPARKGPTVDVTVTHPDKELFPGSRKTKGDLARYFAEVAPVLLPHVAGRPLSLVRCPDGVKRGCFFQRHLEGRKTVTVQTAQDLVDLAQIGVLEIHASGARADDFKHPDVLVFDLDPGPGVLWADTIAAARRVRAVLAELGFDSFPKLTGGKGIHVVARVQPPFDWKRHKELAKRVAQLLATESPDRFTTNPRKSEREGRIFIDYLRNGEGATAIAPWSPRAREGAPVAVPISWNEVTSKLKPDAFSLDEALERAARSREPWAGFFSTGHGARKSERPRENGKAAGANPDKAKRRRP